MSIRWDTGPPRALPPAELEVWNCPVYHRPYFVRFLAEPVAVWLHWIDPPAIPPRNARQTGRGRTVPCQAKLCKRCVAGEPAQRSAYAPALLYATSTPEEPVWKQVIAQVSECAEADIIAAKGGTPWKGLLVRMLRAGRANSRISATIPEKQLETPIPEPFDVVPTLLRMWKVTNEQGPTPTPPKNPAGDEPTIIPFGRKAQ